jgi:hypothetical protein
LGFGGSLASGDLFAVVMFSRIPISVATADRFRTMALDVKSLFFPFGESAIFDVGTSFEETGSGSDLRA